jgi:uncharacterized membrane protein
MIDRIFQLNDKNNDQKLTGDEIPLRMKQNMERIDTNNNQAIEKSEVEKMFGGFRGGGFGRGGGGRGAGGGGGPRPQ